MKKCTKILQCLAFCLISSTACAQKWTADTVRFGSYQFILELPEDFIKDVDTYTEGVFVNYGFPDTAFFSIFHGYNATVSLYKQEEFDTLKIESNIYSGVIKHTGKYWKAKRISNELIWSYNHVNKDRLYLFDRIFESFRADTIAKTTTR